MPPDDPLAAARLAEALDQLVAIGLTAPNLDTRCELAALLRASSPETALKVDRFLIDQAVRARRGLERAREEQRRLKETLERLTAPPWHPAVFLGAVDTGGLQAALVAQGSSRRVVSVVPEVDVASLAPGDEVFLGPELNLVVSGSRGTRPASGETALFDRFTADGRAVLRARDEEVIVLASAALRESEVRSGDVVRFDRSSWIGFERIERSEGAHLFLEGTPRETFAEIGGLDRQIDELKRTIRLGVDHPDLARKYGLRRKGSVLLVGPPGNGKTLVARAIANWLAQLSPSGRSRFQHIAPGRLHSMWYAQSEANYREAFRVAREAGAREPDVPVVMFFDEVDAIGAARGTSVTRVDDRVLTAFMTELDGLEARGNVLVVAATNRRDALDPALARAGRLGDLVVEVPRPNRDAAAAIFARHLSPATPYRADGDGATAREDLIAAAVARIYAPNGLGELASIMLRDGKRRPVVARDLVSGAAIAKIAAEAVESAYWREAAGGEGGVTLADLIAAIDREFDSTVRGLNPANCHRYLGDLPQDVDAVRVDYATRRATRVHRSLRLA
jgi:proteasome-associated ATPase